LGAVCEESTVPEPRAMADRQTDRQTDNQTARQTDRTSPLTAYADLTRRTVTFLSSLFKESNLQHAFPIKLDRLQGKDECTPR